MKEHNNFLPLKLLNIISAFLLIAIISFTSFYIYSDISIYKLLSNFGLAESVLINKILAVVSLKQTVFVLFFIALALVVFLVTSNIYYLSTVTKEPKKPLVEDNKEKQEDFLAQILSLEKQDNKFGYMLSDAWGVPLVIGDSFANILRIDKNSKENIFDLLKKSKELSVSPAQIETMFKSLRSKYINQIEVPLNFSLQDSFYRISIVPFYNNRCLWSVYFAKGSLLKDVNSTHADLLENSPVALMSFNKTGKLTHYNKVFSKIFGLKNVENFKLSDYILNSQHLKLAINDKDKEKEFESDLLVEQGLNGRVFLKKANGKTSWYWLLQNISKDIEGNVKAIRSALIPEPHKEQDLKDQILSCVYQAINELTIGFIVIDEAFNTVYVNKYAASYYDIPKDFDILELFRFSKQELKDHIKSGRDFEVKFDDYWFALSSFNIQGLTGLAIIDCTKSKALEKELTESEGLQTVGQLASAVAHDFNNLLTAIMGFSDFIKSELTPDAPAYKEIEYIRQNSSRAMVMIRKLLTFSRNRELKPVYLDVNIAITEFNATIGRLIGENIQQQFKRGKNIGRILIDESQFQQIITNLVTNAKHAMLQKGGTLLISTYVKTFDKPVGLVKDVINAGSYIVIEVQDQGTGIRKKDLPRLFSSRFSTKGDQGNGFGLYNVYNILRENAGYIDVKSKVGVGTSFFIYLPHYDENKIPQEQDLLSFNIEDIDLTGTGNILLVEDELPVRMVCVRVLREKGYNVFESEDGESALAVLRQNKDIDLLISDVVMPGMDGIELVKNSKSINPSLKVIMMSGYEEDVIDKKSKTNMDIEFISKPFTPQMLATKVKNVLNVKKEKVNE